MGNNQSTAVTSPSLTVPPVIDKNDDKKNNNQTDTPLISPSISSSLRNPGTVEELHKQCKEVYPMNFEGCRMIFNKGLSNHFQVSHTLNMSNTTPPGYRFGATYVGTQMQGPGEAFPILLADCDLSGNLNANIIHQLTPRIKAKCVSQFQDNKCVAAQLTADYKADTYTASCSLINIDPIKSAGVGVCQVLKNFTPKLDLGLEAVVQAGPHIPGGTVGALSLVGRYTSPDNFILSGNVQPTAASLHYYKKIKENFQAGVELETNLAMGESQASLGYQIDIPKADLTFRASVDTNWQVGATLEKKLQPLPLLFTLSGAVDHSSKNGSFKFGCGLIIGQ